MRGANRNPIDDYYRIPSPLDWLTTSADPWVAAYGMAFFLFGACLSAVPCIWLVTEIMFLVIAAAWLAFRLGDQIAWVALIGSLAFPIFLFASILRCLTVH